MNTPRLTDEQRQAVLSHPEGFTLIEDDQTHRTYYLIEVSQATQLYDQWLREQLQVGFDEADRGEVAEWNIEEFLTRMHRERAQRTAQAE